MAGPIPPACATRDCVLLNKIYSYILSPGEGLNLQTAQNVIRNIYYDLASNGEINSYFVLHQPVPPFPSSKVNWALGDATRALALIEKMTNYFQVVKDAAGYNNIIQTVYTVSGKWYISLTSCAQNLLDIDTPQYVYLWEKKYCRVNLGTTLNYKAIGDYNAFIDKIDYSVAAQNIIQEFKASESLIDPVGMQDGCTAISYNSMTNPAKKDLCGCYTTLPLDKYTSQEVATMKDSPACLPTCLSAFIKRFEGGEQQNCNQNTCIIDNIVISGGTASISNDCPLCYKTKNCVCYIHVNDTIISGQDACQNTTDVDQYGKVTSYSVRDDNSGENAVVNIVVIVVCVFILFALGVVYCLYVLFKQYRASRSTATRRRMPANIPQEPQQQPMKTLKR